MAGSTQIKSFNGQDDNELLVQLEYLSSQAKDPTLSAFQSFFQKVAGVTQVHYSNESDRYSQSNHGSSSGDDGLVKSGPRYKGNRSKPSTDDITNLVGQRSEPDSKELAEVKEQQETRQKFAEIFRSLQENIGDDPELEGMQETERNLVQREQQFYHEPLRPSFNNHALSKVGIALFRPVTQQAQPGSGLSRYQKNMKDAEADLEPIDPVGDDPVGEFFRLADPSELHFQGDDLPAFPTDRTFQPSAAIPSGGFPALERVEDLPYDRLKGTGLRVSVAATKDKFSRGSP